MVSRAQFIRLAHEVTLGESGAELSGVRGKLRHASVATTSICLQSDEVKRAGRMNQAIAAR